MVSEIKNKSGQNLLMGLVEDGLKGDIQGFEMRARRFASKIKESSPALSSSISKLLADYGCMRNAYNKDSLPSPVEPDTRQKLLLETYPAVLKKEPIWPKSTEKVLQRFLKERIKTEELLNQGLIPSRSLLLSGPPGCGKTMTAHWLARELNLPLLTLDLATVMSSYLGKTGNNIKAVLNYASSFPCVLLLDEFDAIAKKRDDDSDVGELKRLVTVLLQSIDDWPVSSILVAATNHSDLLDPAIWRRFDCLVEFEYPDKSQIYQFAVQWGFTAGICDWLASHIGKSSLAIIEKKFLQAKKDSILEDKSLVLSLWEVFEFDSLPDDINCKRQIAYELKEKKLTNKEIGNILGFTGQRVSGLIKEARDMHEQTRQQELGLIQNEVAVG